jgi:hypothetical protein
MSLIPKADYRSVAVGESSGYSACWLVEGFPRTAPATPKLVGKKPFT